jgi:predicted permease
MSADQAASLSIRVYRKLARWFPDEFQRACGDEMALVSEEIIRETAGRLGWRGLFPLLLRLFPDLLRRLIAEYTHELSTDVRYALRTLAQSPGFALVAFLSLAIGIGMTTTMYSQLRSTVFRDVPGLAAPEGLVTTRIQASYPLYEAMQTASGQFASLTAYMAPVPFTAGARGNSQRIWGHLVAPNYFDVLQVEGIRGRAFGPAEVTRNASPTAVLSHRFWTNKLGSDPAVFDRPIQINGQPVQVIGVAPPRFLGASPMVAAADIFIPVTAQPKIAPELASSPLEDRRVAAFHLVGRLKPGISSKEAQTALNQFVRRYESAHGDPNRDSESPRVRMADASKLMPLSEEEKPAVTAFPILLAALTLWISCANVATMQLARAASRQKEVGVRLALGAGRARIVRQLLTESMILGLAGGVGGCLFAAWSYTATDSIRPLMPNFAELDFRLDYETLLVTFAVSLIVGVIFGLAPALQASRTDLVSAMKPGTAVRLPKYRRFGSRNVLVLQQVAGSLALLLITGYVVLGFQKSSGLDLGFEPANLTTVSIDPMREGYSAPRTAEFFDTLPDRIRRAPGVLAASLSKHPPLGLASTEMFGNVNTPEDMKRVSALRSEVAGAGYFETLQLPITRGRAFRNSDEKRNPPVLVVNETMARETWPDQDAIEKTLEIDRIKHEVIGVSKDVRSGFAFELAKKSVYRLMSVDHYTAPAPQGITLIVRTEPGVDAARLVRREISMLDANLTVFNVSTVADTVRGFTYLVELTMMVYGGIGLFGLLLAVIGLAGVTAYAVVRRTKEIGIRMALGARRADVLRLVMGEGAALVVAGTIIGQAMAWGISQILQSYVAALSQVMGTSISDPVLVIGAPLLLAALALLACYWPARRSTRIDPMIALRQE